MALLDRKFRSFAACDLFIRSLLAQIKPLRKLIKNGSATASDQEKWEQMKKYLGSGYCTCCGGSTKDLFK